MAWEAMLQSLAHPLLLRYWNAWTTSSFALTLLFAPSLFVRVPLACLWVLISGVLALAQGCYVVYQLVMIGCALSLLTVLLTLRQASTLANRLFMATPARERLLEELQKAVTWEEYVSRAKAQEDQAWVDDESSMPSATLLRRAIDDLSAARSRRGADACNALRFALSGVTKRNHLGIEGPEWYPPTSPTATKRLIDCYLDEVVTGLKAVSKAADVSVEDKAQFFDQVRRTVGVTALCLSGGGAITMYHGGHILGLIEAGVYDSVHVVSGTSGGSIMAAMFGCKTKAELLRDVLVPGVSTDYTKDGRQRREGHRFFPPLWQQLLNFASSRVLVDREAFKRTCDFYWGEMTFLEAYEKTKKVTCISVSAQRAGGGSGAAQRLLMNHITTPHVTLSSAVSASCALPGIQRPQRLEAKDDRGRVAPFEVDGVSWIDGSIQADVPFKRMATLFNVSNFIVAQVNFHVKLIVEDSAGRPEGPWRGSLARQYRRVVGAAELSVRMRATMLSQLGLMPTLYGNNIRKVFSQKYHGDVTISPRFTYAQTVGLSAICNPTARDMDHYLRGGKRAIWPHVCRIRRMVLLENTLAECWNDVKDARRRSFGDLGAAQRPCASPTMAMGNEAPDGDDSPGALARRPSVTFANPARGDDSTAYRQLEWEHKRLQTRLERLRSENLDLRKRLAGIRDMCVSDRPLPRAGSADSLRRESSAESLSPRARADSNPK